MCFKKISLWIYGNDSCIFIYDILEKITNFILNRGDYNDRKFSRNQIECHDKERLQRALDSLLASGFITRRDVNQNNYCLDINLALRKVADYQLDRRKHREIIVLQRLSLALTVIIIILTILMFIK